MELKFGKYKGKTMAQVADEDPEYLEWLLEQEWLKDGQRTAIRDVLPGADVIEGNGMLAMRLRREDINWLMHWLKDAESENAQRIRKAAKRAR